MELSTTLAAVEVEARTPACVERSPAATKVRNLVHWALVGIAAVFWAFHLVHLRADFPNHSPWMDWAKYTDEGWYGDAAIRHYQRGHWYVKGDFNPAAALPVWPALELVVFRFTGVSVVAARAVSVAVFGLILLTAYAVLRRFSVRWYGPAEALPLGPAVAVVLLAVSPFCFTFMRLAILEPMLILWSLCGLLVAPIAAEAARATLHGGSKWRLVGWGAVLGTVLSAAILTKTTSAFVMPSILYLAWSSVGYRLRPFLRLALVVGLTAVAIWGSYFGFFVRPRYFEDYKYLFSANSYTRITAATFWPVLQDTIQRATFMGHVLLWAGAASIAGWVVFACVTRLRCNPLAISLTLWVFCYGAFLAYHDNLAPRYYLAMAIPMTMLVALTLEALLAVGWAAHWRAHRKSIRISARVMASIGVAALAASAVYGASQAIHYLRHPEYTFLTAAHKLRDAVNREAAQHPEHSKLVLSISGSDLSLITGIPSICDDFGTMQLADRVALYRPGWFAAWNDVEDDKMDALAPMYRLVRVGAYPAFDDPDRNLLILYRLDPLNQPRTPRRRELWRKQTRRQSRLK